MRELIHNPVDEPANEPAQESTRESQAAQITSRFLKPIFGFALKRCASIEDAEDLTQDICLKVYRTLLVRDDLASVDKYIWTIAHNHLANYYRGRTKSSMGIPLELVADYLPGEEDIEANIIQHQTLERLQREIARLSYLQRQIVIAYYFDQHSQATIAQTLGLPLGTVKWHLFEAKKELQKGIETMRDNHSLHFNPIQFELIGTNGRPGSNGPNRTYFPTLLTQNIAYCVRQEAKTINEIADLLHTSPVFIESEAEHLAENGFLLRQGKKYISNILIDESDDELTALHDALYTQTAKTFANVLFDRLSTDPILENPDLICDQGRSEQYSARDRNFLMWSLVPYIACYSGKQTLDTRISFDQAATIRPDGGHNICQASVLHPGDKPSRYLDSIRQFMGPCWNSHHGLTLWQIDAEWTEKRIDLSYPITSRRDLDLFASFVSGEALSAEQIAQLSQDGYLGASSGSTDKNQRFVHIVWLRTPAIRQRLLAIGDQIRAQHQAAFDALKKPYIEALLARTPKHLRLMQGYGLQFLTYVDGWFLLYCLKELVNNGKLRLPPEEQKLSLIKMVTPSETL